MTRRRLVAASPVRTATAAWEAIGELVACSLDRSPSIAAGDVRGAFERLSGAGVALVAGGYLNRDAVTIVASPLRLEIQTVSGEEAFSALEEENPNPVPGAATAESWKVHLPRPPGLAALVDEAVEGVSEASTDDPPPESDSATTAAAFDLSRLDPAARVGS